MHDTDTTPPKPVMLCILDGWGHAEASAWNAISLAETPHFDTLWAETPRAFLQTSALDVGLPAGQMGNSEVGHQNIGAGRVVMQDLPRIDSAIETGDIARRPALLDVIKALQEQQKANGSGGDCHLMGLLSPGGVHSHQDHIAALARILAAKVSTLWLHLFLDGRDTPPESAAGFLEDFTTALGDAGNIRIATVSGRYFAMDRDNRWDRVEKAYHAMTAPRGAGAIPSAATAAAAISAAYANGQTDEFVAPTRINGFAGMQDGDGLVMANFRADRAREMMAALIDPDFSGFQRTHIVQFAAKAAMTSYSSALDPLLPALFPPEKLENTLGEVVAAAGRTQLRIAETEKYAHVTFFLNGGEEKTFTGEERILIPSPKVATYDLQPEMAAPEVTDALVNAIESDKFDLIVVNFANPDMVGHTGNLAAAIRAVETIDQCLERLTTAITAAGGAMLVTADHGNIEKMQDPESAQKHTAHTTNPVPLLLVNPPSDVKLENGRLSDIAPTLLTLMKLPIPQDMTGTVLLTPLDDVDRQTHPQKRRA